MGNSDDDFRADGRSSPSYRRNHRKHGGRRRSNPNVVDCAPLRRSSNSSLVDFRSLRRPSAPCVAGGGMKPPIPPNVRDMRKRPGPLSRPMSKERLYSDCQSPMTLEEDEILHSPQDSMMLTASPAESPMSIGGPYPMSLNRRDSGVSMSGRSYSPSENSRSDGLMERRRNRTNTQMNHRARAEDPVASPNEPNRVTSPAETPTRIIEPKLKELKPEGQGRIQYDRNFLLQLQFGPESIQKPASLPSLPEIILEGPIVKNEKQFHAMPRKSFNDFTPIFARSNPVYVIRAPIVGVPGPRMPVMATGPGRSVQRRPVHQKEQPAPRKVIQVSLQQNVQLHTAEKAWKPVHKKEFLEANQQNEELYRKVRGILNKLTPQKFQTLIQQVHDLDINTEEKLNGCIDLIFEKAISEPSFSVAYANMAKCLINLKVPTGDNPSQTITFRKLLLNRCQREFEKDKLEEIDLEHMQALIDSAETEEKRRLLVEEKQQAETKTKKRSLGNIRFIGELYKLKMLTENIMHDCIMRLLRCSHDEDNLECLSRLLTTIGQDIDNEKSRVRVEQYIHQLKVIIDNRKISSRIKFMLQDLLELRKNGWVPRHEDNKPKMIEQIHKEAEQEEQQRQILFQRASQEQRNYRRPRTPGLLSGSVSEEGWRTPSNVVDPSRMKLTKHQVEDIQLGPGGRPGYSTWQRGSSGGGSRTPSLERDKPPRNDNYDYRNYSRTMPRGKGLAMRSMEKDRNAAIAAVRSIAAGNLGDTRITPTNSRNASRDSSCSRDMTRESYGSGEAPRGSVNTGCCSMELGRESAELGCSMVGLSRGFNEADRGSGNIACRSGDAGPIVGKGKAAQEREISLKEIEKKTKAILEEYLQIHDLKEASICVSEFRSSKAVTLFITEAINFGLERSSDERRNLGILLAHLVKTKCFILDHLVSGFREVFAFAEDIEIDIPKIWQYLGELVSAVVMDGCVPLRLLRSFTEPLTDLDKTSQLIAMVLKVITETLGRSKVQQMWQESRLALKDFVPENKLNDYIESQNLSWLQSNTIESCSDYLSAELEKLVSNPKISNEDVVLWIKMNVSPDAVRQPHFVRALMTAVCKKSINVVRKNSFSVDLGQLKNRGPLLSNYLDHDVVLQVQALYALQGIMHDLQHPPSILRDFFDTLYDEDIISEDAFNQWYNYDEPSDQMGKGVAKASVVQFFSWLHEVDDQL